MAPPDGVREVTLLSLPLCLSRLPLTASILKNPMVEADVATILKAADGKLLFLFDSAQIPRDVQAKVVGMGFTDPVVFSKLEDKAEGARKIFREKLDLDDAKRVHLMPLWRGLCLSGKPRAEEVRSVMPKTRKGRSGTCRGRRPMRGTLSSCGLMRRVTKSSRIAWCRPRRTSKSVWSKWRTGK